MIEYLQMHAAMAQTIADSRIVQPGVPELNTQQRLANALNAKVFMTAAGMLGKALLPVPMARLQVMVNTLFSDLNLAITDDKDVASAKNLLAKHLVTTARLHQRVFDLLRQQRSELLAADLITEPEYAWLAAEAPYWEDGDPDIPSQGSRSVRRLEAYDDHELRMQTMRTRVARAIVTCPHCGPNPDQPPCSQCQQLRAIVKDAIADGVRKDHDDLMALRKVLVLMKDQAGDDLETGTLNQVLKLIDDRMAS